MSFSSLAVLATGLSVAAAQMAGATGFVPYYNYAGDLLVSLSPHWQQLSDTAIV